MDRCRRAVAGGRHRRQHRGLLAGQRVVAAAAAGRPARRAGGCLHQRFQRALIWRHLVAETGVGQIFYGTDYPFDWPVGVDFVLNAKFLNNAEKEAILGGTLVKLLRIT